MRFNTLVMTAMTMAAVVVSAAGQNYELAPFLWAAQYDDSHTRVTSYSSWEEHPDCGYHEFSGNGYWSAFATLTPTWGTAGLDQASSWWDSNDNCGGECYG